MPPSWAALGWPEPRRSLLAWKSHLARHIGDITQLMHVETGKPAADAQMELILTIVHIGWAARHAQRVLRPRRVRTGSIRAPYVEPVVLTDVPEESAAVTEETFGPVITITRVADVAAAVRLANASRSGLGASVLAGNRKPGRGNHQGPDGRAEQLLRLRRAQYRAGLHHGLSCVPPLRARSHPGPPPAHRTLAACDQG